MSGGLCVYTLLIGNYESLNEQPVAGSSGLPFICLTDNPALTSDTWTIVQVPTAFPMDPIRSQRMLKICPHRIAALSGFDHSLYIDNSVLLRDPPENFIDKLPMVSGIGLPAHSFRNTVHDEFIEVARLGFDDQGRIFEQLNHYLAAGDPALGEAPFWTAILLRDHRNAKVQHAMEVWLSHVLRYSRRDQLSFNTALHAADLTPDRWTIDNHQSFFHSWPHVPGRDRFAGTRSPQASVMPLPTQLVQVRNELAAARQALEASRRQAEALRESAAAFAAQLDETRAAANAHSNANEQAMQKLQGLQHEQQQQHQKTIEQALRLEQLLARSQDDARVAQDAMYASTSWRITAPMRRLKRWLG